MGRVGILHCTKLDLYPFLKPLKREQLEQMQDDGEVIITRPFCLLQLVGCYECMMVLETPWKKIGQKPLIITSSPSTHRLQRFLNVQCLYMQQSSIYAVTLVEFEWRIWVPAFGGGGGGG